MAVVAQNDGHSAISLKKKEREVRHVIKSPSRVGHSGLISSSTFDCYKPQLYILYLYGGDQPWPQLWLNEREMKLRLLPARDQLMTRTTLKEREKETEEKATIKNEPSCRFSQPLLYIWRYTYKRTRSRRTDAAQSTASFVLAKRS
jgi:hypothetical protein